MQPITAAQNQVLIVEDDPAAGAALRTLLEHYEFEVTLAATLQEASRVLDRQGPPPGHVLLDLMLPDGDGLRLLQRIRAANLPTRVLVMSGSDDRERFERVKKLRPEALLRKPLNFLDVLQRLKRCA